MNIKKTETRLISDLDYEVASGVLKTIKLLQSRYMASGYHDSGHKKKSSPTWIFKFPNYGDAEVGVRMNKRDTTLYFRDRTCDGKRMRDLIPAHQVAKVYPRDGNPAASVKNSSFLRPSNQNEILMLALETEEVEFALASFFGDCHQSEVKTSCPETTETKKRNLSARVLSESDFAALLERRTEVGRRGEDAVVEYELNRLRDCGCPNPEMFVKRVAESDVGRGYDIETFWPGEERYIEVKSSTRHGGDFFVSVNERDVLTALGEKAWLYRVVVGAADQAIIYPLQNPMHHISEVEMTPVVWRIPASFIESFEQATHSVFTGESR